MSRFTISLLALLLGACAFSVPDWQGPSWRSMEFDPKPCWRMDPPTCKV